MTPGENEKNCDAVNVYMKQGYKINKVKVNQ